ncbi:MAG: protoglobin domain-containing protein [Thermaerobacter sp.]|nr:protoglobin domain-containing protein [Thermaerobacter sp.]MDA8146404.1 protoglobin domain-containing protein [Thermaerobacter sp.]
MSLHLPVQQMETIEELKLHYRWTTRDDDNLRQLAPLARRSRQRFVESLYQYLQTFPDTGHYLPDEQVRHRHQSKLGQWFEDLFAGRYDAAYLHRLYRIGEVHVRIGLPPHYVMATMNHVREFLRELLTEELGPGPQLNATLESVHKLLDLNLDVMTSSYREEELKRYLASGPVPKSLLEGARRVSYAVDLVIILFLLLVATLMVVQVAVEFVATALGHLNLPSGVLDILGYLLILYAVSELVREEIKHSRGAPVSLKSFVGVALAAVIRKVLIDSLAAGATAQLTVLALLLLALGGVYFIIWRVEVK